VEGSSTIGTEPLLSPGIVIATDTDGGNDFWCKLARQDRRWRNGTIDHALGKLEQVVDIGEIGCQPNRNTECPLLPIINYVKKLLIGQALFMAKS
jgi:hypothetical protein